MSWSRSRERWMHPAAHSVGDGEGDRNRTKTMDNGNTRSTRETGDDRASTTGTRSLPLSWRGGNATRWSTGGGWRGGG